MFSQLLRLMQQSFMEAFTVFLYCFFRPPQSRLHDSSYKEYFIWEMLNIFCWAYFFCIIIIYVRQTQQWGHQLIYVRCSVFVHLKNIWRILYQWARVIYNFYPDSIRNGYFLLFFFIYIISYLYWSSLLNFFSYDWLLLCDSMFLLSVGFSLLSANHWVMHIL